MKLRSVIVDDELLAIRRLARLLDATARVEVVASFSEPHEAIAFLRNERVDVLFLDIEMPEINGFELVAALDEPPLVVFTTAFDHYALRAFEVSSLDYLLKPVEARQLERMLEKLDRIRGSAVQPDWRLLAQQLAESAGEFPRRIASRIGDRTQLIDLARVTHFVADEKMTYAVTAARKQIVDHTLAELETRLDPKRFIRIHRAVLLNTDYVEEIQQHLAGRASVRLSDGKGTQLPVARDRLRALRQRLGI
jgi:two-component system, LytTR family, response regulator